MASDEPFVQSATGIVQEHGFFSEKDHIVGDRVHEVLQQGINLLSEEGLDFYRLNILGDGVSSLSSSPESQLTDLADTVRSHVSLTIMRSCAFSKIPQRPGSYLPVQKRR